MKISNRYGAKGVLSRILSEKDTPKGEFTGEIDCFISPISILGRKNISMIKELYLGKIFYYINEKIVEMSLDPKITTDKIIKYICDLYSILGPKKIADQVINTLKEYNPITFRNDVREGKIKLFCLIEPFEDISFESIKNAAHFLDIPLEEKIFIPEINQWTTTPVPVGRSYYQFLEHFSDVYANIRGTGKFVGLTRQPTKRKAQGGGQAIARLDMYTLLSYEATNILSELLGPRSDEHQSKRNLYNSIIETGESPSIADISTTAVGGTRNIFNLYITSLGLKMIN